MAPSQFNSSIKYEHFSLPPATPITCAPVNFNNWTATLPTAPAAAGLANSLPKAAYAPSSAAGLESIQDVMPRPPTKRELLRVSYE